MSEFRAPLISGDVSGKDLSLVAAGLDQYPKQQIGNLLWSTSGYKPEVSFVMAYTDNGILLKYTVKEQYISTVYRKPNDPVYKDSCVEAFIAFDNEGYYNFEFNCLGTALVGYGPGRDNRIAIDEDLIGLIETYSVIKAAGSNSLVAWELTLNIPFAVFKYHHITSLNNQVYKANFYKCGDDLPEPHFLSWNNIIHPHPNFHLPEFFGDVQFIP